MTTKSSIPISLITAALLTINGSTLGQRIEGYRVPTITNVFVTAEDTVDLNTLVTDHASIFYSTDSLQRTVEGYTYWFRLDFINEKEKFLPSDTVYIVSGLLDDGNLYYQRNGALDSTHFTFMANKNYHGSNVTVLTLPVVIGTLIEGRYVFLRLKFYRGSPNLNGYRFVYNNKAAELLNQNFVSVSSVENQIQVFLFIGVAGLLFIFNVLLYYSNREPQYLFYGAFLICQMLYYSRGSPVFTHLLFGSHHYLHYVTTEISQVGANLGYLLFVRYFLETKRTLPLLDWVIQFVAAGLTLFIVFDTIFLLVDPYLTIQSGLMYAQRYFMATFAALGVIYLAVKGRGYLPYFIIAGTICYTGGALLTMFLLKLSYMIAGSALESMIFALGISYKIRSIRDERLKHEREMNQVTMSALRAQMNPHFIFNSLNSIQHLISKNDRVNALKYLTKFSTLLRQILESSLSVNVSISKEIELLQIYLQLEAFRFDNSFQYSIEVDDSLDVHNVELPIMLLQPYVENAIAHGLLPKQDGEKRLSIRFDNDDGYVRCEIVDTGIGRKAAMERKHALKINRPSRGLELTKKRLAMINKNLNVDELVEIIDSANGTTVNIRIPKN